MFNVCPNCGEYCVEKSIDTRDQDIDNTVAYVAQWIRQRL
jgi:hypothetical protein